MQLPAATPTTTTLTVSSAEVNWPAPVTLKATVTAGTDVTPGLVKFCNASAASCSGGALVGQAQLMSNGTASFKTVLPIGSYSLKAEFAGTNAHAASTSSAENFLVSGLDATHTTISALSASPYTFTATVSGNGSQPLGGSVSFSDKSTGLSLGTAALGATKNGSIFNTLTFSTTAGTPTPLAVGDFNNDGIKDVVVGDVSVNASGVYTLNVFLSTGPGAYALSPQQIELPSTFLDPAGIAVGDFNHDGNLDLAIAGDNSGEIIILLGNGQGGFTQTGSPIFLGAPSVLNSIAVGDFNNDGNADLAVTSRTYSVVIILLGNGDGTFTMAVASPSTGYWPYSVAVGDFNNDGKQDLAVANYYGSNVTILLGNGDGTFTAAASPSTGIYPDSLAIGDFNNDGKQDIAVVNQYSKTVTVLLGDGRGGFTEAPDSPATGANPDSIAVADFNGDGIPDLAVASPNDGTVTILFGKGDGTFPGAKTISTGAGSGPNSVTAADFNADGTEDFVVAGAANNTVVFELNTLTAIASAALTGVTLPGGELHRIDASYPGSGKYSASTSASINVAGTPVATALSLGIEPSGIVAVGETVQLMAAVSPADVANLTPTGNVSFYNGTTLLGTAPVVNGLAIFNDKLTNAGVENLSAKYSGDVNFLPSASGTSSVTVIAPAASITTFKVSSNSVTKGTIVTLTATVASGGKPVTQGFVTFCNAEAKFCEDSAVLGSAHLTTTGTATVKLALPVGSNLIQAAFGGIADVMASRSSAQTVTVTSTLMSATALAITGSAGNYAFNASVTGSWPPPQGNVSFVDTSNNSVLGAAALFAGTPQFTPSATISAVDGPLSVSVGDFNGDGKLDMAVANLGSNTVAIFLGNGNGTFTAVPSAIPGTVILNAPYGIAVGDFNGDGISDLAVINAGSNNVVILLGNGDGTFSMKSTPATGAVPEAIVAGDFNADGKLDLAIANRNGGTVTILLGNGDGTFSPEAESPSAGLFPDSIVAADFNGDGKLDLAVISQGSSTATILLGNGDGTFATTSTSPNPGATPLNVVVGDFNRDGKPDLVITDYFSSSLVVLLGNGDGTFTAAPAIPTAYVPNSIAVADFNADGIPDLVMTDRSSASFTILIGKGDGTFTPQSVPLSGSMPFALAAADFNSDGGPDLVLTDLDNNMVRVVLNSAVATASISGITVPGSGTHEIEAIYAGQAPYTGSTSNLVPVTAGKP